MTSPQQSAERIYALLNEALSEDVSIRRNAEQALRQAENEPDFFASLVQIATASEDEVSTTISWLAAVCAKNAVPRSWRRRAHPNRVTDDERHFVIETLIASLGESRTNIATQLSVWISAIGRIDFPRHWCSVISDLCERVNNPNQNIKKHALATLDMTLKSLTSMRLRSDRVALQRYGPPTFSVIYDIFCDMMTKLISGQSDGPDSVYTFRVVELCLKTLRRIIDCASADLGELPHLSDLLQRFAQQPELFQCSRSDGSDIQRRLSLLATKLVRVAQTRHPIAFQPYLPVFLPLYYHMLLSYDPNSHDERISYHAAAFIQNILKAPDYPYDSVNFEQFRERSALPLNVPPGNTPEGCLILVLSFFTIDAINKLIETIISKVFVLTPMELDNWANDPETLVREGDDAYWETLTLRNECERLLNLLLVRYRRHVIPHIIKLTSSVPKEQPLLLDACYRAIGRTVNDIHNAFDFNSWLKGPIGTILQSRYPNDLGERIIQARAVWLVGQFTELLNRESRRMVYPWLVQLMAQSEYDRVIVLTAAKALQYLIDDLGFHGEDFEAYLEVCVQTCIKLIRESDTVETKRELLDTVGNLLHGCDPQVVAPVAGNIVLSMPTMWEDFSKSEGTTLKVSENPEPHGVSLLGENGFVVRSNAVTLLQTDIVVLINKLITKTGDLLLQANNTRHVIMVILEYSLDASRGAGNIAMVSDGCELWLSTVMASSEYTDDIRKLLPMASRILGNDFDNLAEIFNIIKAYILLGGRKFINDFSSELCRIAHSAIKSVIDRGLLAAADVMDIWLQAFPEDGIQSCGEVFKLMMQKVRDKSESNVVTSSFLTVLSRAAILNIKQLESVVFCGDESICLEFLDRIVEHLDTLPRLRGRRLGVLALCMMVSQYSANVEVRRRVPDVLNGVVHVLGEEGKLEMKRTQIRKRADFEYDISRNGDRDDDDRGPIRVAKCATLHGEIRMKALEDRDATKLMRIEDVCKDMLMKIHELGADPYLEVLRGTDPAITKQLEGVL